MEYVRCNLCAGDETTLLFLAKDIDWNTGDSFRLVKCNRCGLVYINPRPDNEEMKKYYPPASWPRATANIDPDRAEIHWEPWRKIMELRAKPILIYKWRGKILDVGCGDSLFRPFYSEDEDICYRAWKTGWLVLYEPKSVVFHQPQSTIGKAFKKGQIASIMRRNRFLFIWKNISDKKLLFKHLFFLPFQLIAAPIAGRYRFTSAFFMALSRLKEVANKRRQEGVHQLKDRDVIDRLSSLQRIEDAYV